MRLFTALSFAQIFITAFLGDRPLLPIEHSPIEHNILPRGNSGLVKKR
jgi:hypothetical protein